MSMISHFGYLDKEWTGFVHSFYYTAGEVACSIT